MHAANLRAALGDEAFEEEADGGVHAEGFFDDGLEVREGLGFGKGYGVGELVLAVGGVDFGEEFGVGGFVAAEVVDDCAEGGGSCV